MKQPIALVLLLELAAMTPPATPQGSPASPAAGLVTGRVLDDSARVLVNAELVIVELKLRALTGPDGRFRLERVPLGRWSILVRAIGFLSYGQLVQVDRGGTDLGAVRLHRAIFSLPEVEVMGKIPAPSFGLALWTNLDSTAACIGCDRGEQHLPFGASMTEDGLYVALVQPFRATAPPVIEVRMRSVVYDEAGPFGFGILHCNWGSRPVATRIDGPTIRVLYSTGAVWLTRPVSGSGKCLQAAPLALYGVPIGAAPLPQGWVVAVEDSAGLTTLRGFNDSARPLWTIPLAAVLAETTPVKNVILAPAGGAVTVSLTESPFSWALVDSTGSVMQRSSPLTGPAANDLLAQTDLGGWTGHAVLPLEVGWVQTLESSDRREGLFVLYDVASRASRVTRRAGASVLIASIRDHRMLLGYLYKNPRAGNSRLLRYRY